MHQQRAKRGQKLERTQISLSKEDREMIQRVADAEGVSMSHVIREAVRQYCAGADSGDPWDRLMDIVGIIDTGNPRSSVDHDEIIYG